MVEVLVGLSVFDTFEQATLRSIYVHTGAGDDTLIIQALRDIPPGTEITIDYLAGAVVRELWF